MTTSSAAITIAASAADEAAEELNKSYYTHLDSKRHQLHKFYVPGSTLAWCGNEITGDVNISKFLQDLPETVHEVKSLQAQPIEAQYSQGKTVILISVDGRVFIEYKKGRRMHMFSHSILLAEYDGKWKIARENYRLNESAYTETISSLGQK